MKIIITISFIVFLSVIFLPRSPSAGPASSIDELALQYDSEQCMACHEDVTENLIKSNHAISIINPRVILGIKKEIKSPQAAGDAVKECLSCHAPITENASEALLDKIAGLVIIAGNDNSPLKDASMEELSKLSMNCRVCHMIKGMLEGELQPKMIYGPGWDEHEHSHMEDFGFDTIKSDHLMSSEFCLSCHSGLQPSHKNYKKHYTDSKKTCHECHMNNHQFTVALPTD
jgi:hypothetical protein